MSRHLANALLYKVKVGDRYRPEWVNACQELQWELAENMRLAAIRQVGDGRGEALGCDAAMIGMDRIRSCAMYFDSQAYEQFLLMEALNAVPGPLPVVVAQPDGEGAETTAWCMVTMEVFAVLGALVTLSHRSWSYIHLYTLHDCPCGWEGELADLYLGRTNEGGSRLPSLTPDKQRFELVRTRLWAAYQRLATTGPANRLDNFLDDLVKACRNRPAGQPSLHHQNLADVVLRFLAAGSPKGGYQVLATDPDKELAAALDDVVDRLGRPPMAALAAGAVAELCAEGGVGRSVFAEVSSSRVFQVVSALKPDHRHLERDPYPLFEGIAALVAAQEEPAVTVPREQLRDLLCAQLGQGGPAAGLFHSLLACQGLSEARDVLRNWLPAPAQMLPPESDYLASAADILRGWQSLLRDDMASTAGRPYSLNPSRGVPAELRQQPALIDGALAVLGDWIDHHYLAPHSWQAGVGVPGVPAHVEPAIRAALFAAIVNELVNKMSLVYRAYKAAKKSGATLAGTVLQQADLPRGCWPPPQEVMRDLWDVVERNATARKQRGANI